MKNLYINKECLWSNQEILCFVTISLVLVTFIFDSALIDIIKRNWELVTRKRLRVFERIDCLRSRDGLKTTISTDSCITTLQIHLNK